MSDQQIQGTLDELLRLYGILHQWYRDFTDPSQQHQINLRPTAWENCRLDPSEFVEGKLFPDSYMYSEFPVAIASVYFDGICIQLLKNIGELYGVLNARSSDIDMADVEKIEELCSQSLALLHGEDLLLSVTRILRSAEYFFDRKFKLTGPMNFMFSFHVSFSALCRLNKIEERSLYKRQLRWCHLISEKYEEVRLASLASLDLGRPVNAFFDLLTS